MAEERWSGESSCEIQASIEQVWAFLGDFYSVTSWVPLISCVDESGRYVTEVGCRRKLRRVIPDDADQDIMAGLETDDPHFNMMVCESLLSYDPDNYTFTYAMDDNNLGLTNFVAEVRLWEGSTPASTYIRWTFDHDPIDCGYADPAHVKEQRIAIIENILTASIHMLETAVRNWFKH